MNNRSEGNHVQNKIAMEKAIAIRDLKSEQEWSKATQKVYSKPEHLSDDSINVDALNISESELGVPSIMKGTLVSSDSEIGDYSYIGFNCMVTKAKIGRYASIANNVTIGPGEHGVDSISTNSLFFDNPREQMTEKPCTIGHDVWIADSCIIRRGVSIGTGAVVGANSFVNKDVEPYTVVAGNPAKVIKKRFSQEKINAILESKWWELPLDEARAKMKQLEIMLP